MKHILKLYFCMMLFFKNNDTMHTIRHQLQWVYLSSFQFLDQFIPTYLFPKAATGGTLQEKVFL